MIVAEADATSLTYREFVHQHLIPNCPLLLHNATSTWGCTTKWVTDDGLPNVAALAAGYGDCDVPVKTEDSCSTTMKLTE
jgi:hypothetical protein